LNVYDSFYTVGKVSPAASQLIN